MKLKNRVVVVTGSGSGIGRSCAIEFAKEGARVVVADINLQGAEETVRQIRESGGDSIPFRTDVSDPDSVIKLVDFTIKHGQN
ncbi:MAG: SDR family NAD(P)-dependent oxidoreductase [Bacteroidetes bacterium]|nr:SDR family NAD(P)-dependent oxidoreductase [Bacteroidota bacterium]